MRLLLVLGESHLRNTTEEEVVRSLTESESQLPRTIARLTTADLKPEIESGFWESVASRVRSRASEFSAKLNCGEYSRLCYFGIEEVPIVIALGAYLGDEHELECRDYDRLGKFKWPTDSSTVDFDTTPVPTQVVPAAGEAIIRVEISSPVNDADVNAVVPADQVLTDISIRPIGVNPSVGLIRSNADLRSFRRAFRKALAAIDSTRPNARTVHLFFAGPVSACLTAGQELRLRNTRAVQTYRFRTKVTPRQQKAILLTPQEAESRQPPLTPTQLDLAEKCRTVWSQALEHVKAHALAVREDDHLWPKYLVPVLAECYGGPFELPVIWDLVEQRDSVAAEEPPDSPEAFYFNTATRTWYFDSRMLAAMYQAAHDDINRLQRLARAFYWHEYLHIYQKVTRHTSVRIGIFPNSLEAIDYIADVYGILHQTDYVARAAGTGDSRALLDELLRAIEDAIDAFWTFEPPAPTRWWQQRRIRRYLNWYWRREQIRRLRDARDAVALLSKRPTIEIAGLGLSIDGERILQDLDGVSETTALEIGLVTEDNRFERRTNAHNLPIARVLKAFAQHDIKVVETFFEQLYEHLMLQPVKAAKS